jgi:chromate transporter
VRVSFAEAFRFWLKLGFISFGGPAGQIAIMHQELVERRRWISEKRFLHALNYCMLLPGPEATQLAIYIGWLMHRTWGGVVAGVLFVLPSVFILSLLSWIYVTYGQVPLIAGIFYGIKPAVVAIVLAAAWRIGSRALRHPALWAISVAAFVSIYFLEVPFPWIVLGAALAGAIGGKVAPAVFAVGGKADGRKTYGAAIIDDDTPVPEHARYRPRKTLLLILVSTALWIGVMAAVWWEPTLRQMAVFFTKAAFLTFGGAYAVLPYVYQAAVEHYGWLTGPQMIDGLALGETTPGPLIMVVAFVGFLGAGLAGALVATFFTFLPSFVFILAGGPLVEATHGDLRFTAPLSGITAAVVGVVVSLALFFAEHVFFTKGVDGIALGACAVALVALVRYKVSLIPLVGAMGAAGMLWTLAT